MTTIAAPHALTDGTDCPPPPPPSELHCVDGTDMIFYLVSCRARALPLGRLWQGGVVGFYAGPMLYNSHTPSTAPSTGTALSAEVGSFAYKHTVLTKLHHFGRVGFVSRPVLMACMFGVAGMVVSPVAFLGQDLVKVFRHDQHQQQHQQQ